MDAITPGELVTVGEGAAALDGLVFETPSAAKVIVAVVDPAKGPSFRTVGPGEVTPRKAEGPSDRMLRALVKRTARAGRDPARGATRGQQLRSGFTRGTAHRPTGR